MSRLKDIGDFITFSLSIVINEVILYPVIFIYFIALFKNF